MKDGAYVANLDNFKSKETHWIDLYVNVNSVAYFDNFGVEHIPEKIKRFIGNKNTITSITQNTSL